MRRGFLVGLSGLLFALTLCGAPTLADERFIVVASTTSTRDSGLFDYLLPLFTKKTGIQVRVLYVGTGEAINIAQKGDADVLFVHDKESEEKYAEWLEKRKQKVCQLPAVLVVDIRLSKDDANGKQTTRINRRSHQTNRTT